MEVLTDPPGKTPTGVDGEKATHYPSLHPCSLVVPLTLAPGLAM